MPIRVQLSRKKGWRMPPNTVKVDRSSFWGNPYKPGDRLDKGPLAGTTIRDKAHAVEVFRMWALEALAGRATPNGNGLTPSGRDCRLATESLRGKNLACWCKIGEPCHADVLLELANAEPNDRGDFPAHKDWVGM
jgi:hypothetical protein